MPAPGVAAHVIAAMVRELAALGFDAAREVPALAAPPRADGTVAGEAANALLDVAAAHLGDEHVGLAVASRLPAGALGELDYALCTSPTLRQAWSLEVRFYRLVSRRRRLVLLEEGARCALALEILPGVAVTRHWLEFSLAIHAQRIRHMLGERARFLGVELEEAPPQPEVLARWFEAPVVGGAARTALLMPTALLDLPTRTGLPHLTAALEERLYALAPELDPLVAEVRAAIVGVLASGAITVEEIAHQLDRSARTLQRELAERGTSVRDLVDDVRRARAIELLATGLTVSEVAERLGFSEPGAFYRAFRRWTGKAPGAFRPVHG
ncbi:MAG: AraC family transcriptional regulator ligand-binding domain-containing protein [Kofleriaceae bacterium]|nr:AraC family transcriptional regulator ligand-binding domain-containing protein [Kofleriaceae bacterium]MCL4225967.1 helix-turn-helix transcriptional regulator [Myxococcales bacterium]